MSYIESGALQEVPKLNPLKIISSSHVYERLSKMRIDAGKRCYQKILDSTYSPSHVYLAGDLG